MAGDYSGMFKVEAGKFRSLARHELVRGAVGAVAADVIFFVLLERQGIHICVGRHGLVEGGVENHDLGNVRQNFLHCSDT